MSAPGEMCSLADGPRCFLAKLSVFKQQNRPKNLILPRGRERRVRQDGSEQPGKRAGCVICLPSSGLPPKGGIFLCEVAGCETECCSEACQLALSTPDWSVLGADIPGEVSLHHLPLLISPSDRDSRSISLRRSSFVCETNWRCRRTLLERKYFYMGKNYMSF